MWAISSETVNSLVGLSLNFFFILPLMNSGMLDYSSLLSILGSNLFYFLVLLVALVV